MPILPKMNTFFMSTDYPPFEQWVQKQVSGMGTIGAKELAQLTAQALHLFRNDNECLEHIFARAIEIVLQDSTDRLFV